MKSVRWLVPVWVGLLALVIAPKEAEAIPAFARQAGVSCTACHAHHTPILNDFGKQFKLSGYTMSIASGPQELMHEPIHDKMLSLPSVFNASVMTKTRYLQDFKKEPSKPEKTGAERGMVEMFDEAFIAIAGRIAENWGYNSEFTGNMASGKFVGSWPLAGGQGGLSLFTTDALGPFYGMEFYNTGIYRPARAFENRGSTNAAQVTNIGATAATGLALFYQVGGLFVSAGTFSPDTPFSPTHKEETGSDQGNNDSGLGMSMFYRLAYEMNAGETTGMIGVFGTSGKTEVGAEWDDPDNPTNKNTLETRVTNAMGVDTQWLTTVGGKSMNVTAMYAATPGDKDSIYKSAQYDGSAVSADISYQATDRFFVKGAYLTYAEKDNKVADFTAITPGMDYLINMNMRATLEYSMKDFAEKKSGKDQDVDQLYALLTIAF